MFNRINGRIERKCWDFVVVLVILHFIFTFSILIKVTDIIPGGEYV